MNEIDLSDRGAVTHYSSNYKEKAIADMRKARIGLGIQGTLINTGEEVKVRWEPLLLSNGG